MIIWNLLIAAQSFISFQILVSFGDISEVKPNTFDGDIGDFTILITLEQKWTSILRFAEVLA